MHRLMLGWAALKLFHSYIALYRIINTLAGAALESEERIADKAKSIRALETVGSA